MKARLTSTTSTSHGTPSTSPLPMNANGRSGLNTVVSLPSSRAMPRTAVSVPSVTMNGGSFMKATIPPLIRPNRRPVSRPAKTPSMPN